MIKNFIKIFCCSTLFLIVACSSTLSTPPDLQGALAHYAIPSDTPRRPRPTHLYWQDYGSEQLNQLIDTILDNNLDMLEARERLYRAEQFLEQRRDRLTPDYGADLNLGRNYALHDGERRDSNSSRLALQYELDLRGSIRADIAAAQADYRREAYDQQALRLALISTGVSQWLELCYTQDALATNARDIERYRRIDRLIRDQQQAGRLSADDTVQTRLNLLKHEQRRRELTQQHADGRRQLKELLNRPDVLPDICPDGLAHLAKLPALERREQPLEILSARPDIAAAQARLEAAHQRHRLQERQLYPSITLGAGLSAISDQLLRHPWRESIFGLNLGLNLPFLNYDRIQRDINIAGSDYRSALTAFYNRLTVALIEVDHLYAQSQRQEQSLRNAEQQNVLSQEHAQHRRAQYQAGKIELKDWLESENSADNARLQELLARKEWLDGQNRLHAALASANEGNTATTPSPVKTGMMTPF